MKIYSIKYVNGDIPRARDPIVVPHQKMVCVEVPLVSEGSLTRIIIKQIAGTAKQCKVRVLDSAIPYPPGEYAAGTAAADTVEMYEIISQQTVTAGVALEVIHEEYGFPFHNQDGESFTDNRRFVYLVLEPQSSADATTWAVAITCRTEVG